ncbi:MAG: hypothetical protein QOE22_596 [Candidatus Parcubacteria bacterium]|jgi:hypothetical protein|nr:hypothetical protein [Candidatus Parcubacteria bacterium]
MDQNDYTLIAKELDEKLSLEQKLELIAELNALLDGPGTRD